MGPYSQLAKCVQELLHLPVGQWSIRARTRTGRSLQWTLTYYPEGDMSLSLDDTTLFDHLKDRAILGNYLCELDLVFLEVCHGSYS